MLKLAITFCLATVAAFAQYKAEPAGAPPAELDAAITGVLQKEGIKVAGADGKPLLEVWFRSAVPAGSKTAEDMVTLTTVPHGTLLAAVRFPEGGSDRRGQRVKPGVYTMRFSMFPQNGDHQGVEPQRDFLLLTPAADDKDPNATPNFEALVAMSRKASGTPHPSVFSIWRADLRFTPGVSKSGEKDWVLMSKAGDVPIALVIVGTTEH